MPYDKYSVPAVLAFPLDGTTRIADVDLLGCCGLIVTAPPTADVTLTVIAEGGETAAFTLSAADSGAALTQYPWRLDMRINQIVDASTTVDLDTIVLLKG